jgi:hypothetical protein
MLPLPFHGAAAVLGGMAALCVADQGGSAAYYRFLGDYFAQTGGNGAACPAGGRRWSPWPGRTARAMAPSSTPACAAMTRWAASLPKGTRPSAPPCRAPRPLPCATTTGETIMVDGAIDGETLDEAIALMATRSTRRGPPPADYSR